MKHSIYCIFLAFCLIIGFYALAQDDYIVGEGDILYISVWNEPQMTTNVVVSSRGTITYWALGDISIEGKSIYEIKAYLTEVLGEHYLKNPVVDVRVAEFHSKEINIQGAVRGPGTYTLETNSISLLKLLSKAGGATEDVGSQVYILRGAADKLDESTEEIDIAKMEERIEVDLYKLLRRGDLSQDKIIYGGDFVFVSSKDIQDVSINYVWVEGEVRNQGQIEYQEGMTVFQACIQIGGLTPYAAQKRTTIHRIRENGSVDIIRVNLKAIRKGKKSDVPLQPGDRVTVPARIF